LISTNPPLMIRPVVYAPGRLNGGGLMEESGEVLTLKEVAAKLQVSLQTVYRMVWTGRLQAFRFGRMWRVRRKDLDQAMEPHGPSRNRDLRH